ncbi:MAG: ribosome small subunit-dependent GTPase A [Clostridiales bacterium]|nr:ribosome small subunit-dependent GTPase A [Clostridiales bacterium]
MIDLEKYGYFEIETPPEGISPGRVTSVHRERYELMTPFGSRFSRLKTGVYYGDGSETFPTVGDFVWFREGAGGDGQIVRTLQRKSQFIRRDPYVGNQAVAANIDYVFIMTSLNRDFNINRVERYLVLARQSGAVPVIVLTKADLIDNYETQVASLQKIAGETDIVPVSVVCGVGFDKLCDYLLPGVTVVFLGMSGVGKSSMINALMGEDVMAVNEIRADDSRGRHTTTHRQLFMLPSGAMVIDTPGMRSLGMWDAGEGVSETFADVEALLGTCRFSDCRHETEPGCAILKAIDSGELSTDRWVNYTNLQREALYAVDKTAALHDKWAKNKAIAKWSRQMKKNR